MELLREKLILEEPEELDASVEDTAVETTADEVVSEPLPPEQGLGYLAIVQSLQREVASTYDNISMLQSLVTTLDMERFDEAESLAVSKAREALMSIIDDRTIHVGILQGAIANFNPRQGQLVQDGVDSQASVPVDVPTETVSVETVSGEEKTED